jgi:hypothetical protein
VKFVLALVTLACFFPDAVALTIPKQQDLLDISVQIEKAHDADDQIAIKNKALREADDKSVKKSLMIQIAGLAIKSKNAHEQALWLTIRAYEIIPFTGNMPILDKGEERPSQP